jgi:predicted amidohydrolase
MALGEDGGENPGRNGKSIGLERRMDSQVLRAYCANEMILDGGQISSKALEDYREQIFSNLFGRTGYIYKLREYISDSELHDKDGTRAEIRISCISSPISVQTISPIDNSGRNILGPVGADGMPDLREVSSRDECALLQAAHQEIPEHWATARLKELDVALARDPDIICFGEYAFPPFWPDREVIKRKEEFQAEVVERLKGRKKKPFVFLGSFHCLNSLYHVGIMLPWGDRTKPRKMTIMAEPSRKSGERGEETVVQGAPVEYRKRYPARSAGEQTRVPAGMDFRFYKLPIGRVGVAICSDVVDLNQFMSVARYNLGFPPLGLDFLLVPSFNFHENFASMCRELSHLAGTTVVSVNANHGDAEFTDTEIYCGGFDCKQLLELGRRGSANWGGELILDRKLASVAHKNSTRKSYVFTYTLNRAPLEHFRHSVIQTWTRRGTAYNMTQTPMSEMDPMSSVS